MPKKQQFVVPILLLVWMMFSLPQILSPACTVVITAAINFPLVLASSTSNANLYIDVGRLLDDELPYNYAIQMSLEKQKDI